MSAGFETYRADGSLAVSSSFTTYQFIKMIKGGGTSRDTGIFVDSRNFYDTSGYEYSNNVLVAFYYPTPPKEPSATGFSKGGYLYKHDVSTPTPPANATLSMYSDYPCEAYVFDTVNNMPSPRFGLEVYDETGKRTFSSSRPAMRVVDFIQAGNANPSHTFTRVSEWDWYIERTYSGFSKVGLIVLKELSFFSRGRYNVYRGSTQHEVIGNRVKSSTYTYIDEFDSPNTGDTVSPEFMALVVSLDHL